MKTSGKEQGRRTHCYRNWKQTWKGFPRRRELTLFRPKLFKQFEFTFLFLRLKVLYSWCWNTLFTVLRVTSAYCKYYQILECAGNPIVLVSGAEFKVSRSSVPNMDQCGIRRLVDDLVTCTKRERKVWIKITLFSVSRIMFSDFWIFYKSQLIGESLAPVPTKSFKTVTFESFHGIS